MLAQCARETVDTDASVAFRIVLAIMLAIQRAKRLVIAGKRKVVALARLVRFDPCAVTAIVLALLVAQ